jgi:hypothetical protein
MTINIMIDNEIIELLGDELESFEAQRAKDFAESEAERNSKEIAKASAVSKLSALGLTAEEIAALTK